MAAQESAAPPCAGRECKDRLLAQNRRLSKLTRGQGGYEALPFGLAARGALGRAVGVDASRAHAEPHAGRWGACLLKRGLDALGAILCLFMSAPAWPVIALLIKLESPGPVFIRHYRGGYRERPFRLYKFRSMRETSDPVEDEKFSTRKERGVPRTTRFGAILRRTSLDELPQLLNVLCGDMSLIGPRPLVFGDLEDPRSIARAADEIAADTLTHWRRTRCQVRPGMTGLWQIKGRSALPLEGWLRYDVEYVQRCSPGFDLEVLFRTVRVVIRGIGAF